MDVEAMTGFFHDLDESKFRSTQVMKWIYHHGIIDFDQMTNLSKTLRHKLHDTASISLPKIANTDTSEDGTVKWLLQIDEQNFIETVLIPEPDRITLCISSQAGCPLDCQFCATAKQGFNRNLNVSEIISQVLIAKKILNDDSKRRLTNIVFMGMGEPLLNYDNILTAIKILTDDGGFGLARRKVTISTSGIVPAIKRLATESDVSLAVSLHAGNDELRNQLVPINRSYPLADLLKACKYYSQQRNHEPITIEYVMLDGVNDSIQDAKNIVRYLKTLPAKINLIPFNHFKGSHYKCSSPSAIEQFKQILMKAGFITITRRPRGQDINAACGQLAGQIKAKSIRHYPDINNLETYVS